MSLNGQSHDTWPACSEQVSLVASPPEGLGRHRQPARNHRFRTAGITAYLRSGAFWKSSASMTWRSSRYERLQPTCHSGASHGGISCQAFFVRWCRSIPTWAGFLYLAVVLDAFIRRIVGWSMSTTLTTQVVLGALNMALAKRRPKDVSITRTRVRNIPRSHSAFVAARQECVRPWIRWASSGPGSASPSRTPDNEQPPHQRHDDTKLAGTSVRLCGPDPQFEGGGRIRATLAPQIPAKFRPVDLLQAGPNAPFRGSSTELPAQSGRPAAFNANSWARGSGLVQYVFCSPARLLAPADVPRASCAAPPSKNRYSLS